MTVGGGGPAGSIKSNGMINVRTSLRVLFPLSLMILGSVVLYGWQEHIPAIVQISPDWPPMAPWTAICFFLFGWGLAVTSLGKRFAIGCVLGSIAAAVLFEYLSSSHIPHFDLFWGIPWIGRTYAANLLPGRMAFSTSCCFALAALRLVHPMSPRKPVGIAIATLGLASCWWAIFRDTWESARPWGPWSDMAIHTGIAMCLIGVYTLEGLDEPVFPISEKKLQAIIAAPMPGEEQNA